MEHSVASDEAARDQALLWLLLQLLPCCRDFFWTEIPFVPAVVRPLAAISITALVTALLMATSFRMRSPLMQT